MGVHQSASIAESNKRWEAVENQACLCPEKHATERETDY